MWNIKKEFWATVAPEAVNQNHVLFASFGHELDDATDDPKSVTSPGESQQWRRSPSATIALRRWWGLSFLRERQHQIAGRVAVVNHDLDARKPSIPGQPGGALHRLKIVRHGTTLTPSV